MNTWDVNLITGLRWYLPDFSTEHLAKFISPERIPLIQSRQNGECSPVNCKQPFKTQLKLPLCGALTEHSFADLGSLCFMPYFRT